MLLSFLAIFFPSMRLLLRVVNFCLLFLQMAKRLKKAANKKLLCWKEAAAGA
jgi:hypothetical protein